MNREGTIMVMDKKKDTPKVSMDLSAFFELIEVVRKDDLAKGAKDHLDIERVLRGFGENEWKTVVAHLREHVKDLEAGAVRAQDRLNAAKVAVCRIEEALE